MNAPGYLERSRLDAPDEAPTFPCDNGRCRYRVRTLGELCGHCQGRLDAQIDDLTDSGRIQRCFAVTP